MLSRAAQSCSASRLRHQLLKQARALSLEWLADRQAKDKFATPSYALALTVDVDHTLVRGRHSESTPG
jgi:hypothetical protein